MRAHVSHILAKPLHYPATLAGVDLTAFVAELDGIFRRHGARTSPAPLDLTFRAGRLPGTAIASIVLESDRFARAVVTHVRVAPFYTGLSIAVHPRAELDAPLLVADINIPPPGFTRLFVDAVGPSIGSASFASRFKTRLAPIVEAARGVTRSEVPAWISPLSGGAGARLRAKPTGGNAVLRVLAKYVDAYLEALDGAEPAHDAASNAASARSVRDAVRANGPAGKYLTRTFGAPFADRYLRLLWNDETSTS